MDNKTVFIEDYQIGEFAYSGTFTVWYDEESEGNGFDSPIFSDIIIHSVDVDAIEGWVMDSGEAIEVVDEVVSAMVWYVEDNFEI
jgi:hypothetical protein